MYMCALMKYEMRKKKKKEKRIQFKPAKFRPALLLATAVIIMCDPSRECTKFGGKAVLCRLTMTYKSYPKEKDDQRIGS
jgi:hypothetical protein